MKKELVIHLSFMIAFMAAASVFRNWASLNYWPVWVGAMFGTFLPDVDNLLGGLFLNPQGNLAFKNLPLKAKIGESLGLMYKNRKDTAEPVFHTAQFQLVFLVFAFLLITSSSSLFGVGLVMAFMLHLFIDQITDFMEREKLDSWFKGFPIAMDGTKRLWYLAANALAVVTFGFFL